MTGYTKDEVLEYVRDEDVKFVRLAFSDAYGVQKNVSIMAQELERAFECGIAIDGSAIPGFGHLVESDLLLFPDPATLSVLPWRPEHGKVVRMYSEVRYPDGRVFECDSRSLLKSAVADAEASGYEFTFGSELEFYLFLLDEHGERTSVPQDRATYMDIAPEDKGENVRREVCLTLERMGIKPESSHHEEGPGQNEIDFRYSDALSAADDAFTFKAVVSTIAGRNGLYADFSPRPLADHPGNGYHINLSLAEGADDEAIGHMIAGLMRRIREISLFLDPCEESYSRLGRDKAPSWISWSRGNRSQLIRVPYAEGEYHRVELRSPDPGVNFYLVFSLVIRAALEGLEQKLAVPASLDCDLYKAPKEILDGLSRLPLSLDEARKEAMSSGFVEKYVPKALLEAYLAR